MDVTRLGFRTRTIFPDGILRLAGRVRDDHPAGLVLMPYGHHVLRRRQRLTVGGSVQRDGIADDEGWAVQFGLQIGH